MGQKQTHLPHAAAAAAACAGAAAVQNVNKHLACRYWKAAGATRVVCGVWHVQRTAPTHQKFVGICLFRLSIEVKFVGQKALCLALSQFVTRCMQQLPQA